MPSSKRGLEGATIPPPLASSAAALGIVAAHAASRAAWLESRASNLASAVPLDAVGPSGGGGGGGGGEGGGGATSRAAAESAALSAAIHARRVRRRLHAALLVEAEPVPIAQIKVVRGVLTAAVRATAAPVGGADLRAGGSGSSASSLPEHVAAVALLDACLAPVSRGSCLPRARAGTSLSHLSLLGGRPPGPPSFTHSPTYPLTCPPPVVSTAQARAH